MRLFQDAPPEDVPEPSGLPWEIVLLLLLLALAALWWWRHRVRLAEDGPQEQPLPAQADDMPARLDPASVAEAEGKKFILIVAGAEVAERVIARDGQGGYRTVPKAQGGAGAITLPSLGLSGMEPDQWMRAAWLSLQREYRGDDFRAAEWVCHGIRAMSQADVEASLDVIAAKKPRALVIHYFGHGDNDPASPYASFLTFTSLRPLTVSLPDPDGGGKKNYTVQVSNDSERSQRYYVSALAQKILTAFSKTALARDEEIPKTLIVDGCGAAASLDHKDPARQLQIAVAVDIRTQETNRAAWSGAVAPHLAPGPFEAMAEAALHAMVRRGNTGATSKWGDASRNGFAPQEASATTARPRP